ncbi:putative transporter small subunit [Janibacter terrae]|jgi:heme/copper-type cytochrome/quinol oxidase subunit 2|uniref:Transporter small subunit n=1 Tax=Janibacter terrae TaxID=103817 RepID=A0ABZ2FJG0_9MICO|nr:putative transporter small subunit [Janibacter terrae]
MSITALTAYILVWPVVVAVVLTVICVAFYRAWRAARDEGRDII